MKIYLFLALFFSLQPWSLRAGDVERVVKLSTPTWETTEFDAPAVTTHRSAKHEFEVSIFGNDRNGLNREFDRKLSDESFLVYRKEAVDRQVAELKRSIDTNAQSQNQQLDATKQQMTTLIVDSTKTIPAAVFAQVRSDLKQELTEQFKSEIDALKKEIAELRAQLPSPPANP